MGNAPCDTEILLPVKLVTGGGHYPTPVFPGCYFGLGAGTAPCAALRGAAGQCFDLLREEEAKVSSVPRPSQICEN